MNHKLHTDTHTHTHRERGRHQSTQLNRYDKMKKHVRTLDWLVVRYDMSSGFWVVFRITLTYHLSISFAMKFFSWFFCCFTGHCGVSVCHYGWIRPIFSQSCLCPTSVHCPRIKTVFLCISLSLSLLLSISYLHSNTLKQSIGDNVVVAEVSSSISGSGNICDIRSPTHALNRRIAGHEVSLFINITLSPPFSLIYVCVSFFFYRAMCLW